MYQAERAEHTASLADPTLRGLGWRAVGPNVLFLGLTSLVTDVASEMVTSVFPLYVLLHLQYSPAVFGAIDGLYQGGASLFRVLSGLASDRLSKHREVAALGYATSALSRLGLLIAGGSVPGLVAMTAMDRFGKGIRTSPRDALISLSTPRAGLAAAFGVHRTMDTAGAMLGPVLAFLLLAWLPGAYDAVFAVSLAFALIGVAILVTFVRNTGVDRDSVFGPPPSLRDISRMLIDRRMHLLVVAAAALGVMTLSDGFLYLVLQQRLQFSETYIPLLFVATPGVYMVLAAPVGRLADRRGRASVIVAGYALLAAVYIVAIYGPPGWITLGMCVGLLGAFYAATDGVLMALTSAWLPPALRATGLGTVTTANGLARIVSSVVFGWLWSRGELGFALGLFALGLILALPLVARALHHASAEMQHG